MHITTLMPGEGKLPAHAHAKREHFTSLVQKERRLRYAAIRISKRTTTYEYVPTGKILVIFNSLNGNLFFIERRILR